MVAVLRLGQSTGVVMCPAYVEGNEVIVCSIMAGWIVSWPASLSIAVIKPQLTNPCRLRLSFFLFFLLIFSFLIPSFSPLP
ncbi:hypothetical protein BO99DRAFT_47858 [Aspergillus violaceofuscus CBS 115571]|uniref:Uncharacterized protein n=1 Tax=Aspergillus violaceofuscus (strain CBS 115571) TaxID=1450538 RepID=A0A2V5HCK1_ASPV1|nr:hypothetical protein BO99DRAFT_47858 [Aspergillus violaceofuscus CBS 115571]